MGICDIGWFPDSVRRDPGLRDLVLSVYLKLSSWGSLPPFFFLFSPLYTTIILSVYQPFPCFRVALDHTSVEVFAL